MQKVFLFFLMLPFSTLAQSSPLSSQKNRFEAMIKMDTFFLEKILHEDLEYVHSNGLIETKRDFIKSVATQKIRYENIDPFQVTVKRYGRTALVTGLCKVNGKYNNTAFEVKLRYISVYRKKMRKWQLKSWQSLKIDK